MRILEWLGKPLSLRHVAEHLSTITYKLPDVYLYGNIEDAQYIKADYPSAITIHRPDLVQNHAWWVTRLNGKNPLKWMRKIPARSIYTKQLSDALLHMYKQSGSSRNYESVLQKLNESVEQNNAQRESASLHLEALLTKAADAAALHPHEMKEIIQEICTTQFAHREQFVREAVQNADGAAQHKHLNRIDVTIDPSQRIFRCADIGRGMSKTVIRDNFFNLYASINEALSYAAGKFGIGAASFFGMQHEYVKVDSTPENGNGSAVVVNQDIMWDGAFLPGSRDRGTSIEIKFSPDAAIDYTRMEEVLQSCRFIETPLFLHRDGRTTQINEPLCPPDNADVLLIREQNIEGHVRRVTGEGTLELLDHRIAIHTIPTFGYSGAVNCSALNTILSRDTARGDDVYKNVLSLVEARARELNGMTDEPTLEGKLNSYDTFLKHTICDANGKVDIAWLERNIETLLQTPAKARRNYLTRAAAAPAYAAIAAVRSFGNAKTFKELYVDSEKAPIFTGLAVNLILSTATRYLTQTESSWQQLSEVIGSTHTAAYLGGIFWAPIKAGYKAAVIGTYRDVLKDGSLRRVLHSYANTARNVLFEFAKVAVPIFSAGFFIHSLASSYFDDSRAMDIRYVEPDGTTDGGPEQSKGQQPTQPKEGHRHEPGTEPPEVLFYPPQSTDGSPQDIPPQSLLLFAVSVLGGAAVLYASHREKYSRKYQGQLSENQQQTIRKINEQLAPYGIDVFFGDRLKASDTAAYMTGRKITLNSHRMADPQHIVDLHRIRYGGSVERIVDQAKERLR